jgi:hypothetical protein
MSATKKLGAASFIITEHRGSKMMHVISRPYRSKWWTLVCFCRNARKDGSCLFTDRAIEQIIPRVRPRVRIEHRRGG